MARDDEDRIIIRLGEKAREGVDELKERLGVDSDVQLVAVALRDLHRGLTAPLPHVGTMFNPPFPVAVDEDDELHFLQALSLRAADAVGDLVIPHRHLDLLRQVIDSQQGASKLVAQLEEEIESLKEEATEEGTISDLSGKVAS